MQLQAYEKINKGIRDAGGYLVAISPMTSAENLKLHKKLALSYPILSDLGNAYARQLDLVFQIEEKVKTAYLSKGLNIPKFNGDDSWELPLTAVFLLDKQHTVLYEWTKSDYLQRPEPTDLLEIIKK